LIRQRETPPNGDSVAPDVSKRDNRPCYLGGLNPEKLAKQTKSKIDNRKS